MRYSSQPPIHVSQLHPDHVRVDRERVTWIVCPGCGQWRRTRRRAVEPHTCAGGGRRVTVDVDVAAIEADYRRASRLPDPNVLHTSGKPKSRNPHGRDSLASNRERTSPAGQPSVRGGLAPNRRAAHTRSSSPVW